MQDSSFPTAESHDFLVTASKAALNALTMARSHHLLPIFAAFIGVGLLSLMDAIMKGASLAAGTYTASLLRSLFGAALVAPIWIASGARWPPRPVLKLHVERGVISAMMALSFFFALTKLPIAEAIALSFIAPLIALYLARILLGEQIQPQAIFASLLGLAGTFVIVGGRISMGRFDDDVAVGLAALAFSALLYAYNFIVIRRQSQLAGPTEIATFHSAVSGIFQLLAAPFLFVMPTPSVLLEIGYAAALTVGAAMAIAWAYARAEAQVLVPIEYTGFLWAALFGWLMFSEQVTLATASGAVLIVIGCWIATRRTPPEQTAI